MKVIFLLLVCVGASLARETYDKSCEGPADPGICLAYFPMYYYDTETETCKKFIYGGCQGNGNRYKSEEECLQNCAGACLLKPKTGPCKGYVPSFYYDADSDECKRFIYGGCGGNGNRFDTRKECYDSCSGRTRSDEDLCSLEPETGPCTSYHPSYYYNAKTGKCEEFIYGGCLGNTNRFESEDECYGICGLRIDVEDDVCSLEPETGVCKGYFPMYYFDAEIGECKRFIYGGCMGNGNRFLTEEDCYDRCSGLQEVEDNCSLDPEAGMCNGFFPRYFFNMNTGICEEFIYGGCGGNDNNYKTYVECAAACGAP